MVYFVLEDLEGTVDVIVFPKTYEDYKEAIKEENIVVVEGRLDAAEFNIKLLAEAVIPINDYKVKKSRKRKYKSADYYYLHIETDINNLNAEKLKGLKEIFKKYPGHNRVIIHFKAEQKAYHQQVNENIGIDYNQDIVREIQDYLEHGKVWFGNTA
jgi:DNA polymerase III subunit alpha